LLSGHLLNVVTADYCREHLRDGLAKVRMSPPPFVLVSRSAPQSWRPASAARAEPRLDDRRETFRSTA